MWIGPFVTAAALAAITPSSARSVIQVYNVEELYAAVNDAANDGAMVVLSAGQYALTRLDPHGAARPNGGRLELRTDMSIFGVTGHPEDARA